MQYKKPKMKEKAWIDAVSFNKDSIVPDNNFGAYTKSRYWNEIYVDSGSDTVWQPDVYEFAKGIADEAGIAEIIDVGCGNGEKLSRAFDNASYKTLGIDYAGSIEIARKSQPKREWREANLMNAAAVSQVFNEFHDKSPRLFILSDVIEHLTDPRIILRQIRHLLLMNPKSRVIISTPDSVVSKSFDELTMLPLNPAHVREWELEGLVQFMKSSGFEIKKAGHTRSNCSSGEFATSLVVAGSTQEGVNATRSEYGLPKSNNVLIVTTEHADTKSTGGIGSYIKEVEQVLGDNLPVILYCGIKSFESDLSVTERPDNVIDIRDLVPGFVTEQIIDVPGASWDVTTAVQQILYLYDEIDLIEYQDWGGIGARIAQAKRSAMIPSEVRLRVRCHGTQVYTERAMRRWVGLEGADTLMLEKVGMEMADEVSFPTRYLQALCNATGYIVDDEKAMYERLPYRYPEETQSGVYQPVDTLIFVGKRSTMKGYPDFCSSVADLTNPASDKYVPTIKNILVYGGRDPYGDCDQYDEMLKGLHAEYGINVEIKMVPRVELLESIRLNHLRAVTVLPYLGDNHPVTILEMIANYCPFVAYSAGGVPELFPSTYHGYSLAEPNHTALSDTLHNLVRINPVDRMSLVKDLHDECIAEQDSINHAVKASYAPIAKPNIKKSKFVHEASLVSVMVPVYNKDLEYISDLVYALEHQSLRPSQVIFVDDGSEKQYSKDLEKLIKTELTIPHQFIRQENKGLSGARNAALEVCSTKYLVNIDADDIPLNDCVYNYVNVLENNSEYDIAINCLESFDGEKGFLNKIPETRGYRYLGIGGSAALSISKNMFGHASCCVRTSVAKELSGWDGTDRTKWEDWQFYLRATGKGYRIINVPKIDYLYRVTGTSMVRNTVLYPNYLAELRLARSVAFSTTWDSYRAYSIIKNQEYLDYLLGTGKFDPLYDSIVVKAAVKVRRVLHRAPIIVRPAGVVARAGWKVYKRVRRTL